MNHIARHVSNTFRLPSLSSASPSCVFQQLRGIRVKVRNGNLESALKLLERKMKSSGMERFIKRHQLHHVKNSEKRVLARKNLEYRIQREDFNRRLRDALIKKFRYDIPRTLEKILACCIVHSDTLYNSQKRGTG